MSGELSSDEMTAELAAVADGARMIATITNDMLDLQQMRAGVFAVRAAAASPAAIVRSCVRGVQSALSVPIEVDVARDVPEQVCALRMLM